MLLTRGSVFKTLESLADIVRWVVVGLRYFRKKKSQVGNIRGNVYLLEVFVNAKSISFNYVTRCGHVTICCF